MRKMCKNCLHFDHCINIPSYPVTNNTIACDDWVSKDKYVPVVQGRWEYHGGDDDLGLYGFCSNCQANWDEEVMEKFRYCPLCGAKMDGGNEDG